MSTLEKAENLAKWQSVSNYFISVYICLHRQIKADEISKQDFNETKFRSTQTIRFPHTHSNAFAQTTKDDKIRKHTPIQRHRFSFLCEI